MSETTQGTHPFIRNIQLDEDGVWRPQVRSSVSYPEAGHDSCYNVEDTSFWFAHRNRCIAAVINAFPPNPALPFVDMGGGNGYVAAMIQRMGYQTVLLEPGAQGIAHARERGLAELVQASSTDLQIKPGTIGAVGLFDVVEHIEDAATALRNLHPTLAEHGRIYVTVPAHTALWSSIDVQAGHFRRYNRTSLGRLFHGCGFDVDFNSYYFWPLPPPMFLMRSLPERLGLRRASKPRNERISQEHRSGAGLLNRLLALEERALGKGRNIPFGASCILVASKRAASKRAAGNHADEQHIEKDPVEGENDSSALSPQAPSRDRHP